MSSMLASASMSTSLNEKRNYQPESLIDPAKLTLNHTPSPAENHLSPYSARNYYSNSASPSFNNQSSPGELLSENGYNSISDLSDYDDEFFGLDLGAVGQGFEALQVQSPDGDNYTTNTGGLSNIEIKHTSSSTIYTHPLSPVDTEAPSRQSSTRSDFDDLKIQTSIPNHELDMDFGYSPTSYDNAMTSSIPITGTNVHLTPDRSNSSQGSLGSQRNTSRYPPSHSPRVTVSHWGVEDQGTNTFKGLGLQGIDPLDADHSDDEDPSSRAGLNPDARRMLGSAEVLNFSEQDFMNRVKAKNEDIRSWRTRAASVGGDETHQQQSSNYGLGDPSRGNRPRAKSTGNVGSQNDDQFGGDINAKPPHPLPEDEQYNPPKDGWDSRPPTPRQNKLIEGQIYINPNATQGAGEIDIKLMEDAPRQWTDAPALPFITTSRVQPETSNAAMARFNFDNFSQASRAATWGTRRKSEPSVKELELFTDGGFLKKLSISRRKKDDKPQQPSIFSKLQNKRSYASTQRDRVGDGSLLKQRNDSASSLAPPSRTGSFGKKPTPSLNTAIAAMAGSAAAVGAAGHARSGSFSNVTPLNVQNSISPKSPFNFVGTALKRARSKSDLPRLGVDVSSQQPGIAELWKGLNGPPVPTLSSPAVDPDGPMANDHLHEHINEQDDDDEEDEQGDDYDNKVNFGSPIIATKDGFQAHVRELNPDMQQQFLIERIAHQQMVRYKNLLNMKVKHVQAVHAQDCSSGQNCLDLGGSVTLMDSKNPGRKITNTVPNYHAAGDSEEDSLPEEGIITQETFPPGVPMPPTQHLPAEFECQLCFKVKKFQKPSDWTKHVHEDVQPFTCTYLNCKEPKSFKRKADWVRHENERHRHLEWWTCQYEDCAHKCYRKDNFLQHLVREHKLPEPKQKTKAAVKKAHGAEEVVWQMLRECHHDTTNRPQDEPCKFCGRQLTTWKKLTVHLAKHMEHISLPILTLVDQKIVDAETIISPVEPQPPMRGGFTPNMMIKQGSQSSNQFSDDVSPNMSAGGFPYGFGRYPTPTSTSQTLPQSMNFAMQTPMTAQEVNFHPMYSTAYAPPQMQPRLQTQMPSQLQSANFSPLTSHPMGPAYPSHIGNQVYNSYQTSDGLPSNSFVGLGVSTASSMSTFQQSSHMMGGPDVSTYGYPQSSGPAMDYTQMAPSRVPQGNSPSYRSQTHSQTHSPQPPFPQGHSPNQYPYHNQ